MMPDVSAAAAASVLVLGYLAAGLRQVSSDFGEGTYTPKKYTMEATPVSNLVAVLIWPVLAGSWLRRVSLWVFWTLLAAGVWGFVHGRLEDLLRTNAAGAALLLPWLVVVMRKKRGRDGSAA